MALTFPAGPIGGQQYTGPNGVVYQWDAAVGVWVKVNAVQTATAGATAATGSALIPTGNTAARPAATLAAGQFRYNSQIPQLEYSDGTSWLAAGGGATAASLAEAQAGTLNTKYSSPQTAVPKDASGMAGSAFMPAGNTAARPAFATYTGQLRYNTQIPQWEYSDGAAWVQLVPSGTLTAASLAEAAAGTINTKYSSPETAVPKNAAGMTGSAFIPAGDTSQRPAAATYTGQFRYNTQIPQLEYSNGTAWLAAGSSIAAASLAEAATGTDNTKYSSPQTAVPKDASGMTGAAILPSGTTAQQPGTLVAGMTRYNTTTADLEFYTGTVWNGITAKVLGSGVGATYDVGASVLPSGTNAQRPATPSSGMFRWNTDASSTIGNRLEVYDLSVLSWRPLAYATPIPAQANFTATNGQVLSGEISCANFTIPAGATVTISGSVSIRATGNAIIAGTVNGSGTGTYGPSGYSTTLYPNMTTPPLPGAGIGGGAGNTGGNEYSATVSTAGSSGASGVAQWLVAGSAAALCAGGGNSGSTFLLRASTINVTGTISCNGQDGQSAYVFPCPVAGAGGGSGGTIILDADGTCSNAGTISANGGNGSNGYGLGVLGGGGGGGGQIIVQSRFGTATLGTTNVNGGVAGTQAAGPYTAAGGGGGGNGGPGGNGFSPGVTAPPLPGGAGVAQTFGSPLPA